MLVFPKFNSIAFSTAPPGTLIIHQKKIGFVVQDDAPNNDGNYIAAYDLEKKQFAVEYSGTSSVLAIDTGPGVIIELDPLVGVESGSARGVVPVSSLLVQGGDAYFILPMNPPYRGYVDIKTGKVKTSLSGQLASCSKWKLGIRSEIDQKIRWLIQADASNAD